MTTSSLMTRCAALVVLCLAPMSVLASLSELNMPRGVTPIAHEAYYLHMLILWISVAIGVVVFGVMFYSILMHRRSRGVEPARFHHSTKAEILWTVVPCIILLGMAVPATKGLVAIEDSSESDMTIKVTGYQWMWHYDYLDSGVSFYSRLSTQSRDAIYSGTARETPNYLLDVDKPVVIPVGKKVRILLTSNDVIHSWWVPDFGIKKDAIPGFINEMWVRADTEGTYRGQCAELCGRDHGFMPIVVEVKSESEYDAWVAQNEQAANAPDVAVASTR